MGEQGVCDFLYTAEIPYISTTGTKDANISSFVANSYTGLGKSGACGVHYCGEEGA